MRLKEFLSNISKEELMERLMLLDKSIMELHENGYFYVSNMEEIEVINNEITLSSFHDKIDYLNSGYNVNGDKRDILEMCAIGICAYNHFDKFYTGKEFINYLIDNLDMFLENGNMPNIMQEYYIDVFARGNVDYLNNFQLKYGTNAGSGKNNSLVYTKSTAVGRAFSNKDEAYAKILLLPAILTLVILIIIVVYFIFFR